MFVANGELAPGDTHNTEALSTVTSYQLLPTKVSGQKEQMQPERPLLSQHCLQENQELNRFMGIRVGLHQGEQKILILGLSFRNQENVPSAISTVTQHCPWDPQPRSQGSGYNSKNSKSAGLCHSYTHEMRKEQKVLMHRPAPGEGWQG